jgi:DNA-binding response OmpR family regulator
MKNENEKPVSSKDDDTISLLMKVPFYSVGTYQIDVQKKTLNLKGESKKLTTKEFELLLLFAGNANDILQRKVALKAIWKDDNNYNARSMDVYICKLRKLLKDDNNVYIINIHGKGYKMIVPNS